MVTKNKDWKTLDESTKDAVVRLLIDNLDDAETQAELVAVGLTEAQAEAALSLDLTVGPTAGYVNASRKAIAKLLPFLEQGMRLMANDKTVSALSAGR